MESTFSSLIPRTQNYVYYSNCIQRQNLMRLLSHQNTESGFLCLSVCLSVSFSLCLSLSFSLSLSLPTPFVVHKPEWQVNLLLSSVRTHTLPSATNVPCGHWTGSISTQVWWPSSNRPVSLHLPSSVCRKNKTTFQFSESQRPLYHERRYWHHLIISYNEGLI